MLTNDEDIYFEDWVGIYTVVYSEMDSIEGEYIHKIRYMLSDFSRRIKYKTSGELKIDSRTFSRTKMQDVGEW